jgi:hypothetical protein
MSAIHTTEQQRRTVGLAYLEAMPSSRCKQCDQPLVEIDHWGERLMGCPRFNRWQALTGCMN